MSIPILIGRRSNSNHMSPISSPSPSDEYYRIVLKGPSNPHIDYSEKRPHIRKAFVQEIIDKDDNVFGIIIGDNPNCIEVNVRGVTSHLSLEYKDLIEKGFLKVRFAKEILYPNSPIIE